MALQRPITGLYDVSFEYWAVDVMTFDWTRPGEETATIELCGYRTQAAKQNHEPPGLRLEFAFSAQGDHWPFTKPGDHAAQFYTWLKASHPDWGAAVDV